MKQDSSSGKPSEILRQEHVEILYLNQIRQVPSQIAQQLPQKRYPNLPFSALKVFLQKNHLVFLYVQLCVR